MTEIGTDPRRPPAAATRRAWLGLGVLLLPLLGCGRKGPLYLPPREGAPPDEATPPPTDDIGDDADQTL